MITLHMARATTPSVPGFMGIYYVDMATVLDRLTSKVPNFTFLSAIALTSLCNRGEVSGGHQGLIAIEF
jgi:hypothetical protein